VAPFDATRCRNAIALQRFFFRRGWRRRGCRSCLFCLRCYGGEGKQQEGCENACRFHASTTMARLEAACNSHAQKRNAFACLTPGIVPTFAKSPSGGAPSISTSAMAEPPDRKST